MKIAIFIRGYITHGIIGGMPSACKTLAEGLAKVGNEVHIITTGHMLVKQLIINDNLTVHHVDCETLKYTPEWYENAHRKFIELDNFDIAYSESGANSQFVDKIEVPTIARLHGVSYEEVINHLNLMYVKKRMPNDKDFKYINETYIQYFKDIEILKKYDCLVAISNLSAKVMKNRFFHPNVTTVYNAYNEQIFKPQTEKPYNASLFVAAGHNSDRKGFDVIKRAIGIARQQVPTLQLIIATGKPQEELAGLYQSACAFIDASNHFTGTNMTCIEAMGCGTPVICSDMENFREMTDDMQTYFPLGDAEALAREILKIYHIPTMRDKGSKDALESAKKFGIDTHIIKHMELFKMLSTEREEM